VRWASAERYPSTGHPWISRGPSRSIGSPVSLRATSWVHGADVRLLIALVASNCHAIRARLCGQRCPGRFDLVVPSNCPGLGCSLVLELRSCLSACCVGSVAPRVCLLPFLPWKWCRSGAPRSRPRGQRCPCRSAWRAPSSYPAARALAYGQLAPRVSLVPWSFRRDDGARSRPRGQRCPCRSAWRAPSNYPAARALAA